MHHLIKKNHDYWNHERSLSALLVYISLSLFTWIFLGEYSRHWWSFIIRDLLFNLIIIAGIFSVLTRWRQQLFFIIIAVASGLLQILTFCSGMRILELMSYCSTMLFFGLLALMVLTRIFKEGEVNFYRIEGSIVVFVIIGLVFALAYTIVEECVPGSFAYTENNPPVKNIFSQLLYFSFVIMTTVGIGDMIPIKPLAKSLVVFQSIIGMLYPVIMISRLISMEVSRSMQNRKTQ